MKRLRPISLLLLAGTAAQASPKLLWQREPSSFALLADGRTVWQFRYGKDVPKPMFHPLALVDGTVLTWDSPPDHPWHHALWFSCADQRLGMFCESGAVGVDLDP